MTSRQWRSFFEACAAVLGQGHPLAHRSPNWCSWTTFERLTVDAGYWQAGIPRLTELHDTGIAEGGVWEKAYRYAELAHVIIPSRFWRDPSVEYPSGAFVEQDIGLLARNLSQRSIEYRTTSYALDIKLY